jgi:hypothetical protein
MAVQKGKRRYDLLGSRGIKKRRGRKPDAFELAQVLPLQGQNLRGK